MDLERNELLKDRQRLDWLAMNPRGASITVDGVARPCVFFGVSTGLGVTLREAIDAAMKESPS